MKIDIHEAEIKTATVEIKTLSVSGKQVTLALFRQIEKRDIFNGDGTFAGIPWGTVNYHPDKCSEDSYHVHVVWQKDNELRRCNVGHNPGRAEIETLNEIIESYHTIRSIVKTIKSYDYDTMISFFKEVFSEFSQMPLRTKDYSLIRKLCSQHPIFYEYEGHSREINIPSIFYDDYPEGERFSQDRIITKKSQSDYSNEFLTQMSSLLKNHLDQAPMFVNNDLLSSPEKIEDEISKLTNELVAAKRNFAEGLKIIEGLDQLFIAV